MKKHRIYTTSVASADAPRPNPARERVRGVVCEVRVGEVAEPTVREIRCLDKLIGDLARGKSMGRILRSFPA